VRFLTDSGQIPTKKALECLRKSKGGIGELPNLFPITVNVDLKSLYNDCPRLVTFLLGDPDLGRSLFKEILRDKIDSLTYDDPGDFNYELLVNVRFTNALPDFEHPKQVSGRLTSKSTPVEFTRSACFRCVDKECPNHDMQCYVHRRVPWTDSCSEWTLDTSTTTLDIIRPGDQAKCSLCQDEIEEVPSRRETASVVVGVITSGVPQSRQQGHLVLFSEEWIPHLLLGRMYHVIGQTHLSQKKNVVECLNLRCDSPPVAKWMILTNCSEIQLSPHLTQLYCNSHASSPWSFALSLVYEFGSHICPKQTYFKLKLALLLSMVSVNGSPGPDSEDWPLPVMAVACDTTIPQRLMEFGAALMSFTDGAASNHLGHNNTPLPEVFDLKLDTREQPVKMTNCGGVLGASSGPLCLGELCGWAANKKWSNFLKNVLETGRVTLPDQSEETLNTTLWTYCSLPVGRGNTGGGTNFAKQKEAFFKAFSPLVNVFGSVYFCDSEDSTLNSEANEAVSVMTLTQAVLGTNTTTDEESLASEDLRLFLLQVRERRVVIADETSDLLKNYFISCRRRAKSDPTEKDKPYQSALKTITTMAESFAKLSLRTVVTEYDAALAISLYEENLVAMSTGNATANAYTGSHILHAVHKPHYSASFSALEVIESLQRFMANLSVFNETYTGDLTQQTQSNTSLSTTASFCTTEGQKQVVPQKGAWDFTNEDLPPPSYVPEE